MVAPGRGPGVVVALPRRGRAGPVAAGTARVAAGTARVVAGLRPPASPPLTTSVTRVRAARRELGLRLREFLRTFLLNSDPRPPGAPACPGPAARPRRGGLASGRRCPGPAPPAPGGEAAPPAVRPPGGAGGTCPSGGLERRSPRAHPSHGARRGCSWSPGPKARGQERLRPGGPYSGLCWCGFLTWCWLECCLLSSSLVCGTLCAYDKCKQKMITLILGCSLKLYQYTFACPCSRGFVV